MRVFQIVSFDTVMIAIYRTLIIFVILFSNIMFLFTFHSILNLCVVETHSENPKRNSHESETIPTAHAVRCPSMSASLTGDIFRDITLLSVFS